MRQDLGSNTSKGRSWWTAVVAGVAVLGAAGAAEAGEGHWKKKHGRHFVPPGHVYYVTPMQMYPYYMKPAPVVVYPEPVYVRPPPRYYYYRQPSINVTIPLR
ncbi:MAG: hypothetical protein KIT25_02390 [Enhydrobacter sp.]|nr:MAG: hypothetical protein KIT25_02390 [Enhydrobacter sp.]